MEEELAGDSDEFEGFFSQKSSDDCIYQTASANNNPSGQILDNG